MDFVPDRAVLVKPACTDILAVRRPGKAWLQQNTVPDSLSSNLQDGTNNRVSAARPRRAVVAISDVLHFSAFFREDHVVTA